MPWDCGRRISARFSVSYELSGKKKKFRLNQYVWKNPLKSSILLFPVSNPVRRFGLRDNNNGRHVHMRTQSHADISVRAVVLLNSNAAPAGDQTPR